MEREREKKRERERETEGEAYQSVLVLFLTPSHLVYVLLDVLLSLSLDLYLARWRSLPPV